MRQKYSKQGGSSVTLFNSYLQFNSWYARRNYEWSLACQGHRDDSICLVGPDTTERSSSDARNEVDQLSTLSRRQRERRQSAGRDASHRSQPRRMRSVKPNCLRDKSSVSSVASRLRSRRRTCVYARSCSFVTRSPVIRYTWDERAVSLLFGVIRQDFRLPTRAINRRSHSR